MQRRMRCQSLNVRMRQLRQVRRSARAVVVHV